MASSSSIPADPIRPSITLKIRDAVASWDKIMDAGTTSALTSAMQSALDQDRPRSQSRPDLRPSSLDPDTLRHVVVFHHEQRAASATTAAVYRRGRQRLSSLSATMSILYDMLGRVHDICQRMDVIRALNRSIADSTDQIRQAAQTLAQEKDTLVSQADYLRDVLAYFDDSRRLGHRLPLTNNLSAAEWSSILNRIDDCVSFMRKHAGYSEAQRHLAQFQQLRAQALSKICTQFQQLLQSSSMESGESAMPNDHVSIALLAFRSAAGAVRPLIAVLEQKAPLASEYDDALQECVQAYYQIRQRLLYDRSDGYMASLAGSLSLPEFARTASLYLVRVCSVEARLFSDFFRQESSQIMFLQLISSVSTSFYTQIRSRIIAEEDLDVLSDVISIVQCEILDDEVIPRGAEVDPIIPVLQRIVEDVQERLTYRAVIFIQSQVSGFRPDAHDLDYPGKLAQHDVGSASLSWYPTLETCLMLLSKLYRAVEQHVFEVLAQDAISACLESLRVAADQLPTPADSALFLVRHLAIFKDQLAPFDLRDRFTERALDLAHLTESMRLLISGRLPALTLTETEGNAQMALDAELDRARRLYIHQLVRTLIGDAPLPTVLAVTDDELVRVLSQRQIQWDPVVMERGYQEMQAQLALYLTGSEAKLIDPIRNQVDSLIEEIRNASTESAIPSSESVVPSSGATQE